LPATSPRAITLVTRSGMGGCRSVKTIDAPATGVAAPTSCACVT
jgi:hypothetical protein